MEVGVVEFEVLLEVCVAEVALWKDMQASEEASLQRRELHLAPACCWLLTSSSTSTTASYPEPDIMTRSPEAAGRSACSLIECRVLGSWARMRRHKSQQRAWWDAVELTWDKVSSATSQGGRGAAPTIRLGRSLQVRRVRTSGARGAVPRPGAGFYPECRIGGGPCALWPRSTARNRQSCAALRVSGQFIAQLQSTFGQLSDAESKTLGTKE